MFQFWRMGVLLKATDTSALRLRITNADLYPKEFPLSKIGARPMNSRLSLSRRAPKLPQ